MVQAYNKMGNILNTNVANLIKMIMWVPFEHYSAEHIRVKLACPCDQWNMLPLEYAYYDPIKTGRKGNESTYYTIILIYILAYRYCSIYLNIF